MMRDEVILLMKGVAQLPARKDAFNSCRSCGTTFKALRFDHDVCERCNYYDAAIRATEVALRCQKLAKNARGDQ
jgi:hypothetical protein